MGTWYGNKLVSVGDDVWFYNFGTKIDGGYASASGTKGNCHGKVTSLYASSYAFPVVIKGTVTAGTGGSFTGCTVKPSDMNWGYQNWITYNGNGGSVGSAHQTGYVGASLTGTASRTGYTFAGWYSAASGGSRYTTVPNSNGYTFYAHWTAHTYSVKYNANNGSGSMSNSSHTYGTAKALTANAFTRTGYTFSKWNTKADGTGTSYSDKQSVSNLTSTNGGTVNLYAQWTANKYTVKFNGNGANNTSMADQAFVYDTPQNLSANTFSRGEAYKFTGWNTKADGTGTSYSDEQSVSTMTATNGGTITLYAQWEQQYIKPTISNVEVIRSNSLGIQDDAGSYLHVDLTFAVDTTSVSAASTNYATSITIDYRETNTTNWTNIKTWTYSSQTETSKGTTLSFTSSSGLFSTEITYDIRITVTDSYGTSLNIPAPHSVYIDFLSQAFFTMDWAVGGKGIGIGCPAPATGLKVAMDTEFTGDVSGIDASFAGDLSADNINLTGDITDGSSNTLSAVASTAASADETANAVKSTTDKKIKNITVKYVKKTVSIAAGSSTSAKSTTVSFTAAERNNGTIVNVTACMSTYQLPYINVSSKLFTWISAVNDTSVTISNTAGAWSGYDTYFILFLQNTT